ncbi:GNAT family N-acetyltransferase [Companilactobacillus ginsenosidimutans]|uniref:Acetyltransferase n=1 Tax=Companilactobacillus ginsenosidimutans TaxID=1007676 RepID=A0A0H4QZV8_9LACO|nr:GNAT family N-acetyltransferase [Companilactobacillus ginsenosidimutans]AKP66980.1 acetyltransferase [Companilactobacillus ginsenosidimutans]
MEMRHGENRFYLFDTDTHKEVGEIVYSKVEDNIISIDHTRVDETFQGHGFAGRLLNSMLDYADLNNLKIVPVCEYAKVAFKKRPEIRFLLADNYQELLKKLDKEEQK